MQKTFLQNGFTISGTQQRNGANNTKKDIRKIQLWLTLFAMTNAGTAATSIDGDFGKATEQAVKHFQKAKGVPQNGVRVTEMPY